MYINSVIILQFKEEVGKKFLVFIEQLCLIFVGKILKDGDILVQYGIKDGFIVYLVIKLFNRVNIVIKRKIKLNIQNLLLRLYSNVFRDESYFYVRIIR